MPTWTSRENLDANPRANRQRARCLTSGSQATLNISCRRVYIYIYVCVCIFTSENIHEYTYRIHVLQQDSAKITKGSSMSILNMALPSLLLTVAHIATTGRRGGLCSAELAVLGKQSSCPQTSKSCANASSNSSKSSRPHASEFRSSVLGAAGRELQWKH